MPLMHLALDWSAELGWSTKFSGSMAFSWFAQWQSSLGADQIAATEIRTGLWTLRFLAITLAVTPARKLLNISALARYRRMLGLFVFFYAVIHVATWSWADTDFDVGFMTREVLKHRYILVGMLTFLILIPLAATSTKGMIRRLGGKRWNRLHQLVYVAAVTGTIHYLWAVKKDTFFPLVYLAVFAALLAYRFAPRLYESKVVTVRRATR